MKLIALFLIITLSSSIVFAQDPNVLTNESVIKLHKAGFGGDVLKSKIQSSPCRFDVTIDGLMGLKKAGVPDDIINMMISSPGAPAGNNSNSSASSSAGFTSTRTSNTSSSSIDLASGIYYRNAKGEHLEIEPSVITSSRTNAAAQLFVSALINAKQKASLPGSQSDFVIRDTLPHIIFVFDVSQKNNLNNDNNQWYSNARSPKEFLLVKFEVRDKSREITVGKGNVVSSNAGIDEKSVFQFTTTKLTNGIYEIVPDKPLRDGEYCIMFSAGIKKGESSKVFDFSIRKPKEI